MSGGRGEHCQTNGASLEDCHTNFFALTDVCGIKWAVYRESESPIGLDPAEDAVLVSYARCLSAELLAVWRRVPKVDPTPSYSALDSIDEMSGQPIPQPTKPASSSATPEDKNLLCQKKELWVFWYGDQPEGMKKLIAPALKEVQDISGTWENGLKYEARSLLFKALNNLIERNLLSKEFVRLGRWFIQPFDGPDKSPMHKCSHLSFAFDYFIHGESSVCASVDVRQHPAVRRLALHHLTLAKSQTSPVPVILAPYGLAATLTGVSFKATDSSASQLLKEWNRFYPLDRNRYFCQDQYGDLVAMPPAIEVRVAGVRLVYPTCYVLVSDMDLNGPVFTPIGTNTKTMNTFNCSGESTTMPEKLEFYGSEPSPFTTSNHPLLVDHDFNELNLNYVVRRTEAVWQDALCTNPENMAKQQQQHHHQQQQQNDDQSANNIGDQSGSANGDSGPSSQPQTVVDYVSQWEFSNPGKIARRKHRNRPNREKSKDRIRFNPKIPFHRKTDLIDGLAWSFGQTDMMCANSAVIGSQGTGGSRVPGSNGSRPMGPPGSVKDGSALGINSPASVGPVTPGSVLTPKAPAPGSVRTPGDPMGCLASPLPPPSNGPLTPMETDGLKPPQTPKSVPTYSPFPNVKSIDNRRVDSVKQEDPNDLEATPKTEPKEDTEESRANQSINTQNVNGHGAGPPSASTNIPFKRPALPMKEYEEELSKEDMLSDHVYDYQSMQHWLNHPVKKFRPAEARNGAPLRPIYRRNSQANVFNSDMDEDFQDLRSDIKRELLDGRTFLDENRKSGDGVAGLSGGSGLNDPYEFSDGVDPNKRAAAMAAALAASNPGGDKPKNEDDRSNDLFSTTGLKPSMDDLDNMFDDSSDETDATGHAPTPPDSNKPANHHEETDEKTTLKLLRNTKIDPTGNLPHDQLAKMFPTPPSHEHNHQITSPAEIIMDMDGHPLHLKNEPMSPPELMEWSSMDDHNALAVSSFAPLDKLYSTECPALQFPFHCLYKPRARHQSVAPSQNQSNSNNPSTHGANATASTPVGTPAPPRPGMSPISPLPSLEGGPRSHGPASVGAYHPPSVGAPGVASPASVSSNYMNKSINSVEPSLAQGKTPEANALILTLVLSDTLLNLYRDHNFNSCTLCVCNNDGNIRGRDASSYLTEFAGEDEVTCTCGYSAVINRRMAHQSGLFYEDESEVTSVTEDMYFRKKPSLLLLDPKCSGDVPADNNKAVPDVDRIPPALLDLIHLQSIFPTSAQNALLKYSKQYLKSSCQLAPVNMVELMDANNVIFQALEQVKNASDPATTSVTKLEESQKQTCLHRWPLLKTEGPLCSEDVIRVMGSLQPCLHESLHVKKTSNVNSTLSVLGPLTWRQFHRMAGPSTKGNTDDQCEPLPVPVITVGHESDFLSISPLSLHYWEHLSLEPFSMPRDVVYFALCPDNDLLLGKTSHFFKTLSNVYESCRLGKHVPKSDFRDGIIRIGKKAAMDLRDDEADRWFDMIGESPTACLLKLYAQVCRHYLLPLLLNLTLDQSLLKKKVPKEEVMERSQSNPQMNSGMNNPYESNSSSHPYQMSSNNNFGGGMDKPMGQPKQDGVEVNGKEGGPFGFDAIVDDSESDPPAVMIYLVDPFSFGVENLDMRRLSNLALLRSFMQMLPHLKGPIRHNIHLQVISMDNIVELSKPQSQSAMPNHLRGLAFSIYSQVQRPYQYHKDCKTLTGFGPASGAERFFKANEAKANIVRHLYQPPYVLAQPSHKKKSTNSDSFGGSNERSSTLFVNYCLSEDQHWLFASCCDDRGELVRTNIINVEIPNKTRRKKASARRVGLSKLMDWILSVMAMSLVPWRLVIGRIGRIGHGELRGWSVLLSRRSLKKSSKQLRDICPWNSEVPSILSACLVSLEPDSSLRLMADQYTPDERFGQTASHSQLSTPKDASCTHILVFPTSATAQSSQKAFEDTQGLGSSKDDIDDFVLGLDLDDLDQNEDIGGLGDLNIFFDDPSGGVDQPGSPSSPKRGISDPNSPSQRNSNGDEMFRYDQEEPGKRIEILQQPLALGYLVSTAKTGPMPKWFWSSCPHLENVCPVFLRSALHINQANIQQGGDDGFSSSSASSGRVHSLDSTYTTDVLRYVLEGYNALSWLNLDSDGHDRRSCLPVHVQLLQQIYANFASLV